MSSYKLQAKNKKTGEIVEFNKPHDDGYGTIWYNQRLKNGPSFSSITESEFNELYEVVNEETADWEKEFDRHIQKKEDLDYDYDEMGKFIRSDENKLFEEYCYPENMVELHPNKVKEFIKQTLQKERESIVREIEEVKQLLHNTGYEQQAAGLKEALLIIQNR